MGCRDCGTATKMFELHFGSKKLVLELQSIESYYTKELSLYIIIYHFWKMNIIFPSYYF